ncbi:MAG: SpoVG family protein [Clostridia bacterium]|nr:SpoVG family protein [Clostridia bacterium]
MNITDVKIRLIQKEDSKLKAVASITIDNAIAIHDIKIVEGSNGYFISMPSRKIGENEHKDIAHPINAETRALLHNLIIDAFNKELSAQE